LTTAVSMNACAAEAQTIERAKAIRSLFILMPPRVR
jgi:hypothetical protein